MYMAYGDCDCKWLIEQHEIALTEEQQQVQKHITYYRNY